MNAVREGGAKPFGETEYLEQRLDDQINWYDGKSVASQRAYKRLRLLEIVAAAAIPLLAGYIDRSVYVGMVIGGLGLIVAVIAAIMGLYRFQENWTEYRALAESLKQQRYLYLARAEPYNGAHAFELLVQHVEGLLNSETTEWVQATRAAGAADEAEREVLSNGKS